MATIQEIRSQYPQYADLSDQQLGDALYQKHYSDMPREEFNRKVGLTQQSWGEWGRGVGGSFLQGATSEFGDELGLIDRERDKAFAESNPVASGAGRFAGAVAPFLTPGLGLGAMATRAASGPLFAGRLGLSGSVARSAALGSGVGLAQGLGAGEGDLADRLPSAANASLLGTAFGAAGPVAGAAIGAGYRAAAPVAGRIGEAFARTPEEPLLPFSAFDNPNYTAPAGAMTAGPNPRFINDMTPADIGGSQQRMLRSVRDALLREGTTPQQLQADMEEFATWATRMGSNSYGQNVATFADMSPALQRILGVWGRQSPQAERYIKQFIQARQTGVTPPGADDITLGRAGVASDELYAPPIKGSEAAERFGPNFQRAPPDKSGAADLRTGLGNVQPMGHQPRMMDILRRAFGLKDYRYHGHGATAGKTIEKLEEDLSAAASSQYGRLHKIGERLALDRSYAPIVNQLVTAASSAAEPRRSALMRAANIFSKKDGTLLRTGEEFDRYGIRILNDEIDRAYKDGFNAIGGELRDFKNQLLQSLRDDPNARVKVYARLYDEIRSDYSQGKRTQEMMERFTKIWQEGDPRGLLDEYGAMTKADQKLAREAMLKGALDKTSGTDSTRNVIAFLRTQRAKEIMPEIVRPELRTRTGRARVRDGEEMVFADTPQRLGAYAQMEDRFRQTAQTAIGGSPTAGRIQDDLMAMATDTMSNVQTLGSIVKGNQSLYQLVERGMTLAADRAFGVGADAAAEGARVLLTANPVEQAAFIRQLIAIWPADRMAHYNQMVGNITRAVGAAGISGATGAAQAGAANIPQGPMQL